jgi:ABC-type branched-subunit amino acid transport system substrate-binding protein
VASRIRQKMYELRSPRPHATRLASLLISVVINLLAFGLSFSQGLSDYLGESSKEVFKQARELYGEGEYEPALERFEYLLATFLTDRHYTGFMIMASRCRLRLGKYDSAERGLKGLLEQFPQSSYRGVAYILLGDIAFLRGEPLESTLNYLRGFELAERKSDRDRARQSFLPLLEKHLTLEELERLSWQHRGKLLGEVFFHKGRRESEAGQSRRAIRSLERFLVLSPGDVKGPEAEKLLEVARKTVTTHLVVGVLAPLSGAFADYGNSMVRGIKLALADKSNPELGQVELAIEDTKGEAVAAALAMRAFVQEDEVAAIIGPLRSETAVGAAVNADCHRFPVITPTASEAGIAGLSDYVYQLSPSSESMARGLASYAVRSLKVKEFATLVPNDSHGPKVSTAFKEEVEKSGGKVLKELYYAPGQTDFKEPLGQIREILIDKTKTMWETGELDSSIFFDDKGDTLPPEEWPVYLGGLFILGYPEDLNLIAPQVAFSIIKTQLLGLEGFSDPEALRPSRDYVQDAVFCCHFIEDQDDSRWFSFSKSYKEKYGESPDWVAALSYDCATLLLKAFASGAVIPEKVNEYLKKTSACSGVTGEIKFDKSTGENQAMGIYRIQGNSWQKLK